MSERLKKVIKAIDIANNDDPVAATFDGMEKPHEWVYSQRMKYWLHSLEPGASELLQIAAYGQHIRRWEIPRDSYPLGKKGYYAWRNQLKIFHGEKLGEIMAEAAYSHEDISRVKEILSKKLLKHDKDSQTLEDVICIVFLENYFSDFSKDYDEKKLGVIVLKTWHKMSQKGRSAALKLPLKPEDLAKIKNALKDI